MRLFDLSISHIDRPYIKTFLKILIKYRINKDLAYQTPLVSIDNKQIMGRIDQ